MSFETTNSTAEIAEEHRLLARDRLNSFLLPEFPPAECTRVLLNGEPAAEITRHAESGAFELIIMPTHAGRFRRMLLGSTTAKVLNDTDCPVLTAQHAVSVAPRSLEHRKWLCAISLTEDSARILRLASEAASAAGAQLSLVHAIQAGRFGLPTKVGRMEANLLREASQRAETLQKTVGCDVPLDIIVGPDIKQALVEAAHRSDADVFMVGRGPRASVNGRMRDLTYQLVRDSPFPVLSL